MTTATPELVDAFDLDFDISYEPRSNSGQMASSYDCTWGATCGASDVCTADTCCMSARTHTGC
jgi:hypothetical protein